MPMSSQFQIKMYYVVTDWLLMITFDVVRGKKCEFQVHYLKKRDFFLTVWLLSSFEPTMNSFIKSRYRGQSSNHNFGIYEIWTRKADFFAIHAKTTKFHYETKNRLNTLSLRLPGGIIRVSSKPYVEIKMVWDFINWVRILTGKKYRQIKLQRLQKVAIWAFGTLVHQINSL